MRVCSFRVTQFLSKEGFYSMWNWFDDRTWYPLGRTIGGTLYPVSIRHSEGMTQTQGDAQRRQTKKQECSTGALHRRATAR